MYQRELQKPIWRETNQMTKSMMNASVHNNARNVNYEKSVMSAI